MGTTTALIPNADDIKGAVAWYYRDKLQCSHYEVGLNKGGRLRADVVALNMRGMITIIEVKSCKRDFMNDYKWESYLNYCHRFQFAMSPETYAKVKQHIPKGVGVLLVTYRGEGRQGPIWAAHSAKSARQQDMDPDLHLNMVIRMAYRASDVNRRTKTRKRA